jgi:hypothetical protein
VSTKAGLNKQKEGKVSFCEQKETKNLVVSQFENLKIEMAHAILPTTSLTRPDLHYIFHAPKRLAQASSHGGVIRQQK